MKFLGEPNMHITDSRAGKLLCKFDDKGEFITNDEKLIERLKRHFRCEVETKEVKTRKRR